MNQEKPSGLQVRREVMGDAFVDRALGNATAFTQPASSAHVAKPGTHRPSDPGSSNARLEPKSLAFRRSASFKVRNGFDGFIHALN